MSRNAGLVQLLGLCPLLAVTTTAVNGVGLGLATMLVLILSNALVSLSRRQLSREIRIPAYVLIIAALVTCIEMILEAWFPLLDRQLGLFVALIVTNCAIIARAEAFASRQPLLPAVVDGTATGAGFAAVLVAVGALRELIGQGSMFRDWQTLFGGPSGGGIALADGGLLLAVLPPGAFFALAALIAANNARSRRRSVSAIAVTDT